MDDEIQFGEVEEASPQISLRPDRNKHYAVVEYGSPEDRDLPIFVDLDVLADMEDHALSDTSVELGGVLLGQTCTDEAGRPFIVVTDSLRAQHYESTKGSFTFTHDTWSAITRERDAFPADLAMVGWYHTHPGFGVFLSGMDLFIQDNFFNLPWQAAWVYDPIAKIDGMFVWREGRSEKCDFLIEEDMGERGHDFRAALPETRHPQTVEERKARRSARLKLMAAVVVVFVAFFLGAWFLLQWLTSIGYRVRLPIE